MRARARARTHTHTHTHTHTEDITKIRGQIKLRNDLLILKTMKKVHINIY